MISKEVWKNCQKSIVLMLVFLLVFNMVGLPIANAMPGVDGREIRKELLRAQVTEIPTTNPDSPLELPDYRTRYSLRYLNPDGSFSEQIYLTPINYLDPIEKIWKPIDNNLCEDQGYFRNIANDYIVSLIPIVGAGSLFQLFRGEQGIIINPLNTRPVKGIVADNRITYPNIYGNVDLSYTILPRGIKEELVLKNIPPTNTIQFELDVAGDLKPTIAEDGGIYFLDQNDRKVWYLEKPFMEDANGRYSDQVSYKLNNLHGKFYLELTADQGFLADPATTYPVVIDPTLVNWDVIRDTFVSSSNPDASYSSYTSMYTGATPSYGATRSLAQFVLPTLPTDSVISTASFQAYQTKTDATLATVQLNRVESAWTGSVTWNTQPVYGTTPESVVTSNQANVYWEWDITQLLKDWYNGVQPNYGILLKQQDEYTSPWRAFNTVNATSNTPQLVINYQIDPIGVEDFWTLTKDSVNPVNGNFAYQEVDFSITGRGVPTTLARTYNSRKQFAGIFGYGWRSTFEMQLIDSGNGPITFIDADGTRHIYGQDFAGGYVTPNGVYLDLVKNADGTYTMLQPDQTLLNFDSNGKLYSQVDPNENITKYFYNTNGKVDTIQDASGRLTTIEYGTNGYVSRITDPGGLVRYYYYNSGNLTQYIDPEGNPTYYGYDANHNLTGINDARGYTTTIQYTLDDQLWTISRPITINGVVEQSTTTYTYDTVDPVTVMVDGEGNRTEYLYNPNGYVEQIAENPLDPNNSAITTYGYDIHNNLTQIIDPNTNRTNGTASYIYAYDDNGNLTGAQLPENQTAYFGYNEQNSLIQEQDFKENSSWFGYDEDTNRKETTDPQVQTVAGRYDTYGNLLLTTHPLSSANNYVINGSFEYDLDGNNWPDAWTQGVQPGTIAIFNWADQGRFGHKSIEITNPTGWALVSSELVPYVEGQQYILSGYIKTVNTNQKAIIKIEYFDSNGNWLGQNFGFGLQGTNDWTRIQAIVDDQVLPGTAYLRASVGSQAGTGTAYFDGVQLQVGTILSTFNLVENSSFERDNDGDGIPDYWNTSGNLAPEDGIVDRQAPGEYDNVYIHNHSFRMTGEPGVNKFIKQRIYFAGDETTPLTLSGWSKQVGADPLGGNYLIQIAINYQNQPTSWTNANDFSKTDEGWQHIVAEVNPTGPFDSVDVYYYYFDQTGTAWFDAMRLEEGDSISYYEYDAAGNYTTQIIDPLGNTFSYTYDNLGNITSTTDGEGYTTDYLYNKNNQLTQVIDPYNQNTFYGYDAVGNRTSTTNAKNYTTNYAYNEWNLISGITDPLNREASYEYNQNGNLTGIIYPNGNTVTYTYNDLGRLDGVYYNGLKQWGIGYDANGKLNYFADRTGATTNYGYNDNEWLVLVQDSPSTQIEYLHDDNGNPQGMQVTAGIVTTTRDYVYNSLNQLAEINWQGNKLTEFIFDERDNLIANHGGNGTYISYNYDEGNRLAEVKNFDSNGELISSYNYQYNGNNYRTSVVTDQGIIDYQYDALGQLIQETLIDGTTITYTYDAAGNRTQKVTSVGGVDLITDYVYDAANQLIQVNGVDYTHDANGNLLADTERQYSYNAENRLVSVQDTNGSNLATFEYDYTGKRSSKTTLNGTRYYHYDQQNVAYETDVNDNIIAEYIWDQSGRPVAMIYNDQIYYYHLNGHNDVTAMTDENGTVVAEYQYDAWGNIVEQVGPLASINPYRYAGYRYDEETGLYYLLSRYYNPETGRFITQDVFRGFEDDPSTLNRYVYVKNNPVNLVDPTGQLPALLVKILVGAGSGVISGVLSYLIETAILGRRVTLGGLWSATWKGAVSGAITSILPMPKSRFKGILTGAAYSAGGWLWDNRKRLRYMSTKRIATGLIIAVGTGIVADLILSSSLRDRYVRWRRFRAMERSIRDFRSFQNALRQATRR